MTNYTKLSGIAGIKKDNPIYFDKGNDRIFGVEKREYYKGVNGKMFMRETQVHIGIDGERLSSVTVRPVVEEDGKNKIGLPKRFCTSKESLAYLNEVCA